MEKLLIPEEIIKTMVSCVEEAVGNDIQEDKNINKFHTMNSIPFRTWDYINRNLIDQLEVTDCITTESKRGCWNMVIVYEKTTQNIFTFMRENRFIDICKKQRKRKRMHYLDILTKNFNSSLIAQNHQLSILDPNAFSDEHILAEKVNILLNDLRDHADLIRNHVLVLFDTTGSDLISIRAVMLTSELEIAFQQDWSGYIYKEEAIVTAKVEHSESPANNPTRGLKLKPKALERQKNKPTPKVVEIEKIQEG